MCRLTAYAGAPLPAAPLVFGGSHSLYEQSYRPRELLHGTINADGWGVVWFDGGPARIARAEPVWYDGDLRRSLETIRSRLIVAALRNATPGLTVDRTSVLPIVVEDACFVLNGSVPDWPRHVRALRASLPDDLYARLRAGSDAATLAALAQAERRGGAGCGEALEIVAANVFERVGESEAQLTMVLADGDTLAVANLSNVERVNSLYTLTGGGLAPEGTLVASERLDDDPGWRRVEPQSVIEITADGISR